MNKTAKTLRSIGFIALSMLIFIGCDPRKPTPPTPEDVLYHLNLSADNDLVYADNGKTMIHVTATVTDEDGVPLNGVSVNFWSTKGTITGSSSTNTSGQAAAEFDDDGQAGENIAIIGRYTDAADNEVRDTLFVDVLPMEALVKTFFTSTNPTSGRRQVTGIDTAFSISIYAQVRDSSGVQVPNVVVNYGVLSGTEVGALDKASDSTGTGGRSTAIFSNNPGAIGNVEVTAYVLGQAIETVMQENPGTYEFGSLMRNAGAADIVFADTVTLEFMPFSAYTIRAFTDGGQIYADDGATVTLIRALVKDQNNQGVDTVEVRFSSKIGTVNSPRFTNDAGIAETIFSDLGTDITQDTTAWVYASIEHPFYGEVLDSVSVAILAEDPSQSDRIPDRIDLRTTHTVLPPYEQPNVRRATLTATITDTLGFPVNEGTLVEFDTDIGYVTPFQTTDANGVAEGQFTMGDSAGIARVYARSGVAVDSVLIEIRPGPPAYIVIPPSTPRRIVVQGGWGAESTTIRAEVRDARGELVDLPYEVCFELGPIIPSGANLNGEGVSACDTTNYGVASVTLNSGVEAGPVRVRATVIHEGNTINSTSIPVTIVGGAPAYIDVDIDVNDFEPIGGGMYEAEIAARVWDQFTNPVEDTTQVYWSIYPPDLATILGESYTNNENKNGDSYEGIAWSRIYWNSDRTFDSLIVYAQTWDANGDTVVGILNAAEDSTLLVPFYPGTLVVIPAVQFWDFQPAANPNPDPVWIGLTAILVDYYNNPIKNARILFQAIGASDWDPVDPDTGLPIIKTNNQGIAVISAAFSSQLCTPNFNTDGSVSSYNPFTAFVGGTLLDPQSISSEQVSIELRRSIQE